MDYALNILKRGDKRMENMINLETFANGAFAEKVQNELAKVIKNIADPNTDSAKTRSIDIKISFKPNKNRNMAAITVAAKSSIAPAAPLEISMMIGVEADGEAVAAEIGNQIIGQLELEIPDQSTIGDNVMKFKKTQGGN